MTMPTSKKKPARKTKKQSPASAKKPSAETTPERVNSANLNLEKKFGWITQTEINYWDSKPHPRTLSELGTRAPIPSIDTVATLAVNFLPLISKTNRGEFDFETAVESAIRLMDMAARGIEAITNEIEISGFKHCGRYQFADAVKIITGQKRKGRALEALQDFWEAEGLSKTELLNCITHHEKQGFIGEEVQKQKREYSKWLELRKNKKTL